MPIRGVSQKRFLKGVVANFDMLAQPPGSVPRLSNYIYTNSGSLLTCDGSQIITSLAGGPQSGTVGLGPITEVFLYQPVGAANSYYAVVKDLITHVSAPTGLAVVDGGAGGNLSAGNYSWVVTAVDGAGGETSYTTVFQINGFPGGHKANLTWTLTPLAAGYNVYRNVAGGGVLLLVNPSPITTNSYVDNIADGNLGTTNPPLTNNTQTSRFMQFVAPVYSLANTVIQLPADFLPAKDNTPGGGGRGGGGGGTGGGTSGNQPPTPSGGVPGNISPIPQIVQFANKMFLALGNGLSPYVSDGTTVGTVPITNTFTAQYPQWAVSIGVNVGDQIQATVSGTAYIFECTQAGITGASGVPAWSATLNATVLDTAGSKVIWKNVGTVTNSPAPRGAAHVEVYAGSLWVANTATVISSDQLDGPSAVRMSDANNPTSWNPLNAAQLSQDDSQQIQGIKAFSIADAGIPTTEQLVIFKDFSTYVITGVFGAQDFAIQQAQTDMGCIAPRTINFLPGFGIARMTHLGIAVFDGLRDKIISEEIHPYIFPPNLSAQNADIRSVDWNYIWFSKGAQTANPPMYACAVPLVPPAIPGFLAVTSVGAGNASSNIPFGSYFVVVYMQDANGIFYKSNEFGPVTLQPGNAAFHIELPSVPSNALNYYILYGPQGAENTMITLRSSAVGLNAFYGSAGIPSMVPFTSGGMLSRMLCYDLVLKAWTIIDLPFAISTLKQFRTIGSVPITGMAGFSDGAMRRWSMGDPIWDAGATVAGSSTTVASSVRGAEIYSEGATQRIYFRNIVIRGVGTSPTITVTPRINNVPFPSVAAVVTPLGTNRFVAESFIGATSGNMHVSLATTGIIEIESIDVQLVPKPTGAPVAVFS